MIGSWFRRGIGFALGVAVVYGIILLGSSALRVLVLLFVAILLAAALTPVAAWIRARTGLPRLVSILLVYASLFAGVVLLALLVVPAAVDQAEKLVSSVPTYVDGIRAWAAGLQPAVFGQSIIALLDSTASLLRSSPAPEPGTVVEVGTTVADAVITIVTLLVVTFFWMIEHARLQRYVLAFVPSDRRAGSRATWTEIEGRLGMWVRGQLVLMGTIGLAAGIAYALIGLPGAMLLAVIAAITEAIPIVGPLLGAIPAILVAATVSPTVVLLVVAAYLAIHVIESVVLVPLVMRSAVGISPLLVLLSLLVGGAAGGILGAFLAVPIAATLEIIGARLQAREVPVVQDAASLPDQHEEPGPEAPAHPDHGQPSSADAG